MQGICQFGPGIDRLVAFSLIFHKIHPLQSGDNLTYCVSFIQFFLKIAVHDQGDKTGHEVRKDAVLPLHIYRPCLKIRLHDAEAFFDFPAALIHLDDRFRPIPQICADGIEAVILFLAFDYAPVYVAYRFFRSFPGIRCMVRFNKPPGVILSFFPAYSFSGTDDFFCPLNLPVPYGTQVIPVLDGIGHDQLLSDHGCLCGPIVVYRGFFLNPAALKKYLISVIVVVQFPYIVYNAGRPAWKTPSLRVQRPFP